ncbi:hypothetical protein LCGC14_1487000, partial [marine sediment metagenome]
ITSEQQNNRIATMQSIHASILEYTYQAFFAQKTQEKLNEIAYTVFITAVSTALSLGVSAASKGIGSLISGGATASQSIASLSQSLLSQGVQSTISRILGSVGTKIAVGMFKVVGAIVSEVYEELMVDPLIEAYVSSVVADAGGNWYEQIFWSSLVESGRETGLSMVTQTLGSMAIHSQVQISQNLDITAQNSIIDINQMKAELEAQKTDNKLVREIKSTLLSSLLVFAGVGIGGIFGSAGIGLANLMIPIGMIVEARGDVKDMVEDSLKARQPSVPGAIINIHSEVSDGWKARIVGDIEQKADVSTFSQSQKTSKISELLKKYKAGIKTATFVSIGIAISIVTGIFNPLLGSFVATGFTMGAMRSYFIDNKWKDISDDLYGRNRDNIELITRISVRAINQLYSAVERNIPVALRARYGFKGLSAKVIEITAGRQKVISSGTVQRLINGALLAVEQHIINEDNEVFEKLVEYNKLSLALENTKLMDLRTDRYDSSSRSRVITKRLALYEKLRNLLKYQNMWGSEGFIITIDRFGKLIKKPMFKQFLKRPSRMNYGEYMELDYKIQDFTIEDLESVGMDYSKNKLETFKRKASQIIKEFMFSNPYSRIYINKEDMEVSEKEDIDYVGHKFDLIRLIGYVLYRAQYSSKFIASKTPIINFETLKRDYIAEPRALTNLKINELLEIISDTDNFNQKDPFVKQAILELNKYKETFAQVSTAVVGIYTHVLEELAALTSLVLDKKISIRHESLVEDGQHVADLSIQVDRKFRSRYSTLFMQKYQIDLSKIDRINIDFSNSYKGKGKQYIKAKFLKNYQSAKSISLIILTNHKLYDKTIAKTFIGSFNPYLNSLGPRYFPQHIKLDTMDEFISIFGIKDISKGLTPLTDLKYFQQLKDEALSHNPDVANKAFEKLYDLYRIAKLTLALIKNDPANAANILKTRQLTFL